MTDILIEQAVYSREGSENPRLRARSSDFLDEWLTDIEWLVLGFGDPPRDADWSTAVYAQPLGKQHVAVVQVAMRSGQGQKAVLYFHVLVIPRQAYTRFLGDPFAVAQRLPPPWDARDELPTRSLPAQPLPARTVHDVQRVLKQTKAAALKEDVDPADDIYDDSAVNALSPALLGGVQILVDGGRVVFERPAPEPGLVQGLWMLLPTSTRCHLWPASFAYGSTLHFDAVVTPHARKADYAGYTREEQAADYPEGRYERRLQSAAEAGDQAELDALFARRSGRDTIRLALILVVIFSVVVLGIKFFDTGPQPPAPSPARVRTRAAVAVSLVGSASPLPCTSILPVAQQTWNRMERQEP